MRARDDGWMDRMRCGAAPLVDLVVIVIVTVGIGGFVLWMAKRGGEGE